MDEWNPILRERVVNTVDPHEVLRDRVTAAIIALIVCLGLVGWLIGA